MAVVAALAGPTSPTSDFAAFWRAGRWLTGGRGGDLYPSSSFGALRPVVRDGLFKGFLNPPHTAVLFAPLAHLGLRAAALAFALFNAMLVIGLAGLAWRYFRSLGVARLPRATAVLLIVACPAVATAVVNGTMSLLILAAVLVLIRLDRDGDAWSTGIPLAVMAWKPQFAVLPLVYLVARRHYRAVTTAAAMTLVSIAASLPFTGVGPWRSYVPFLDRYAATLDIWDARKTDQHWLPSQMLNVRGLLVRALGFDSVSAINTISALTIVAAVVLVFALGRRVMRSSGTRSLDAWGAVVALTVVTSQHTNVSDGVVLLVPAVLLSIHGRRRRADLPLADVPTGVMRPRVLLWWVACLDLAMIFGNPSGRTPLLPWSALAAVALATVASVRAFGTSGTGARAPARSVRPARRAERSPLKQAQVGVDGGGVIAATPVRPDATRRGTGSGQMVFLDSFLLATLAIAMTVMPYVIVGRGPDAWQMSASLSFADLIALVMAAIGMPAFVCRLRGREADRLIWAGLAVFAVLVVTTAAHLSPRGVVLTTRFLVGVMLADLIARTDARRRDALVRWLGIAVLFQCAVAVAQRVTRHAVGLAFLGEPLYPFRGGYPVPAGTMRDAYPLAAFGLFVAALHAIALAQGWRRGRFSGGVVVAGGVIAGLTGSRAAILTAVLIVGALVLSCGRKGMLAAGLLVGGLALSMVPSHELWTGRVATGSGASGGADVSNGRSALNGQALEIIRRHPLLGVGPGNYSRAVRAVPGLEARSAPFGVLPVHDMPLLAGAESGALIVFPLAFVMVLVGVRGMRRRGRWLPLLLAIVPYLLLDLVYWFYPEGVFLVAIAIGFTITGSLAAQVAATTDELEWSRSVGRGGVVCESSEPMPAGFSSEARASQTGEPIELRGEAPRQFEPTS